MNKELFILCGGVRVGRLNAQRDSVSLAYERDWRTASEAFPLSLSLSLNRETYGDKEVAPYLWNLLPDNERVLGKWAQRFSVSPRNAFALIGEVGEDVAGAMQFVKADRLDDVLRASEGAIDWLSLRDVGERLADLHRDESAWSRSSDVGFFSLSGAQPKLALFSRNGKWGVPSGRTPTTHILKPPSDQFDGHAENEHFCLTLAGMVGLPVALSEVRLFDDQVAIVVERFDRIAHDKEFIRVPTEDVCQALNVHPANKYQNRGGPGAQDIVELLREHSTHPDVDICTFIDALAFNWLIGGTDAHAKNYSLLFAAGGRVRLAPLYDIASALGYKALDPRKMKMAMKIGGHYEMYDISARDWAKLERGAGLADGFAVERINAIGGMLADAIEDTRKMLKKQGLKHPLIDYLCSRIQVNVKGCLSRIRR